MTTSKQKAAGSEAERYVARKIGGQRLYGYGPVDVSNGSMDVQVKAVSIAPSLNAVRKYIADMPEQGKLRAAVVIERPGAAFRARRTITFDFDEWCEWYGSAEGL